MSAEYTPESPEDVAASGRESARMLFAAGLEFWCESRICAERRWRFDFLLKHYPIALEIDGGVIDAYTGKPSGHQTWAGYRNDRLRDSTAMSERGIYVYRTTTDVGTQRKVTGLLIKHAQRLQGYL